MKKNITIGSLFDGSGGFPLAAQTLGIEPVWSSEIEPLPCRVTEVRFPNMTNYGDVNKIDGANLAPVDIITLGSPCQDLSIAGERRGLSGKRSSLFFEAVRIIKEMRDKTNGNYPRFVVWENVTGALTSNKGEDFKTVLETLCSVCEPSISVPRPERWADAGEVVGANYSIVWRVLNAQFWGVPQRRRRIYAVADFGSEGAREVLFNKNSVCINPYSCKNQKQDASCSAGACTDKTSEDLMCYDVRLSSLNTKNVRTKVYETTTSRTLDTGPNAPTSNQGGLCIMQKCDCFATSKNSFHTAVKTNVADTLVATDYKDPPRVSVKADEYRLRRIMPCECARLQGFPATWCDGLEDTNPSNAEIEKWQDIFQEYARCIGKSTRRKTKAEVKRWLENPRNDTAEYKMWGNGVALPCVLFVLDGIVKSFEKVSK